MPGGGGSQTIGYKYYLGMHMVLCHGPIDHLCNIKVDGRLAWTGSSEGGREEFDEQLAGDLFGGDKREGGIGGEFDVEMGGEAQEPNGYLLEQLGEDAPAFRGVAAIVLNQCYVGNNPYLKGWSFCAQRIHVRQNGLVQWYDEKAAIGPDPLENESYLTLLNWGNDTINGGTGEWYREPTVGATPVAAGSFGTNWRGTIDNGELTHINSPSIPIGNVSRYFGSITIPPLESRAFIRVRIYHDDSITGTFSVNGGSAGGLVEDSYYYSHKDVVIAPSAAESTISFSYSVIQGVPSGTTTGFGGGYLITVLTPEEYYLDNGQEEAAFCSDMNPAHIIRECLTDPDWGMGYLDGDIDDVAFMAAADALYEESLGMSLLWDRQIPLEDFISEILRHIDGVLYVDRVTGRFVLKLIRDDYALSNLLILNEYNVGMVSNARRPTIGELTNSVTVSYYDKNNDSGMGSAGVQDQALIHIQGATIGTNIQYTGFTNYNNAARAAQRDLKALSIPLLSADIVANREAASLNVGDPFIFSWPDMSIDSVVMRVQAISVGDGRDNSVKITALEDVFSLTNPSGIVTTKPDTGLWVDPTTVDPQPALPRIVTEAPYWTIVQDQGQLSTDTVLADDSDAGYLWAAGGRQGSELNANLIVDSGAGYVDSGVLDFAPYAYLSVDASHTDVTLYYTGGVDIEDVVTGTLAQIDDELVRVDGFGSDSSGDYVTVGRGVLDTVPAAHVIDTSSTPSIVFIGDYQSGDGVQYTASDILEVKMRTVLGSSILADASTPVDSFTMDSRAIRPYPPGDLQINSDSFPEAIIGEAVFTWAHRDRLQQTSGTLYDTLDASIGPEASTTYTLRIYDEDDALIHTEAGLTGESFTYDLADEIVDSDIAIPSDLYKYTFTTNGSFTLSGSKELIMVVVGGGGAGATFGGGGGGGGGVAILLRTLSAATYAVTVGTGAASTGASSNGANGSASSIDSFIEGTGGNGGISGSGGNIGGDSGQGLIDSVVVNPANADGGSGGATEAGGGGGAGAAATSVRNGGDGLYSAFIDQYFGGGGGGSTAAGGGTGGLGGGGAGGLNTPIAGTDGLGGGGGGKWNSSASTGTAGGDGVVIVISDDPSMSTTGTVSVDTVSGLRANGTLRVELESIVGAYTSAQMHNYSFDRAGWGYQYGKYYGGI